MKYWILSLVAALIITNGYWLYNAVDNGVSYTYLEASFDSATKSLEQTTRIANLNVIGKTADEILKLLNPNVYGLEPFEKEGCIYAAQVCLKLDEARIVVSVE